MLEADDLQLFKQLAQGELADNLPLKNERIGSAQITFGKSWNKKLSDALPDYF
jgi:hypothetical protein